MDQRIDTASRMMEATAKKIYRAFINPKDYVSWLPPSDMKGIIHSWNPIPGGEFEMSLIYTNSSLAGKTSANEDRLRGKFLTLIPNKQITLEVIFESDDPNFSGIMKQTWLFTSMGDHTKVTIECQNVPSGIRPEDHEEGFRSTLENLARYVEN